MKFSATTLAVAAALGVAAHPSGFAHKNIHRQLDKRIDFYMNAKPDGAAVNNKAAVVPSPATPTVAPPPPPPATTSAAKSTPSTGSGSGGKKQFCGGVSKRASIADIAYQGNIGAPNNYGCNLMLVDDAKDYEYTATIENNSGKDQKCAVWLKIGKNGGVNGFFKGNQVMIFDLPAGGEKIMAAEPDSQGGLTCGVGEVPTNDIGLFTGTWFEFDYASVKNKAWSGADASCLTAADSNRPIPALSVCAEGHKCSTIKEGGVGDNAYVKGTNALDGVGINVSPGPVNFKVTVS
ncbi:allergen Asp F4-like protein [Metarhizium anisopliae]